MTGWMKFDELKYPLTLPDGAGSGSGLYTG